MSDQYAVSIRHSYTMPDETFYGYELVLWHSTRANGRAYGRDNGFPTGRMR